MHILKKGHAGLVYKVPSSYGTGRFSTVSTKRSHLETEKFSPQNQALLIWGTRHAMLPFRYTYSISVLTLKLPNPKFCKLFLYLVCLQKCFATSLPVMWSPNCHTTDKIRSSVFRIFLELPITSPQPETHNFKVELIWVTETFKGS
jgi:hypothetical protein